MGFGGRPKGAKNKRTLQVDIIAERLQVDPFEILMKMAAGDWKGLGYDTETYVMENASGATKVGYTISPEMRLSAAKECCQYLHSKRKEETDEPDEIEVFSIEEKKKLLYQAKKEIQMLEEEIGSETNLGEK